MSRLSDNDWFASLLDDIDATYGTTSATAADSSVAVAAVSATTHPVQPPDEPETTTTEKKSIRTRFVTYRKGFREADGFKGKLAHAGGGLFVLVGIVIAVWIGVGLILRLVLPLIDAVRTIWVNFGWHGFMNPTLNSIYRIALVVATVAFTWYFVNRGRSQRRADREAKATWRSNRDAAAEEIKQLEQDNLDVPEPTREMADSKEPIFKPHRGWFYGVVATFLVAIFFWAMPYHYAQDICASHGYDHGDMKADLGCYNLLNSRYTAATSAEERNQLLKDLTYVSAEMGQLYGTAPPLPGGMTFTS